MTIQASKLSDTGRALLTHALPRKDRLVPAPRLPLAAARQVVRSLVRADLLEEVPTPPDEPGLAWRDAEDGTPLALRATEAGVSAVAPNAPGRPARPPLASPRPKTPRQMPRRRRRPHSGRRRRPW